MRQLVYILSLMLAVTLTACQGDADDAYRAPTLDSIFVTIAIDSPLRPATRAVPTGGEGGDGWELGQDGFNENTIYDLTVFRINGTAVEGKYIPAPGPSVSGVTESPYTPGVYEYTVKFARGKVEDVKAPTGSEFLVVANYGPGLETITELATLKDKVSERALFQGTDLVDCDRFLMSSAATSTLVAGHKGSEDDPFLVHVDLTRLAARLDFCTTYDNKTKTAAYGLYSMKDASDADITIAGFKYDITANSCFILTSIVPFNIYNESEYLFRRVRTDVADPSTETFLGAETTTNYVIDPKTADKLTGTPAYTNPLGTTEPTWDGATGFRSATSLSGGRQIAASNNYVVAYVMENTLRPDSPIKQYATGLALTGTYFKDDKAIAVKTFYCFLRHQGEADSYKGYEYGDIPAGTGTGAMNFSIVRNNIYRMAIEKVNPLDGGLIISISIHDWMKVEHAVIYS